VTSIKAKMNKDKADFDGLSADEAVAGMLSHPERPLVVVAILDVVAIEHNVLTGVRTPKVAMRANEILTGELAEAGSALLDKEYAARTGRAAPPATLWDAPVNGNDPAAEAPTDDEIEPASPKGRRGSKAQG
jgi:hypothetical protein